MDSLDDDIKAIQEYFPEYSHEIEVPYQPNYTPSSYTPSIPPPSVTLIPPPPPPVVLQPVQQPPTPTSKPVKMTPTASVGKTLKRKPAPAKKPRVKKPKVERSSSSESDVIPTKVKKSIVDSAKKRVKEAIANDGDVEYEPGSNKSRTNWPWLFTIEKALRFSLCDNCVKMYLADEKKVNELDGGYIMVTMVLCPKCIDGNNDAKRAYKNAFGKQWSKSTQWSRR